ncbi:hypothetical protein B0H17DRAFT_1151315 [Mycena rosella]|uniref:Uncharacterized protein n=1 Tax=Mycena rosella TaxID=1033263 RepID=A0AAD7BKW9_MYCRO|nr:hypothetical protein B0H17DRAFT_1151315 [Mycena rosella]
MPETPEGGYDMPEYIADVIPKVDPLLLQVKGFGCDPIDGETQAMKSRGTRVLQFAKTLEVHMLQDNSHATWAKDLYLLAQAVPDTHGLLIHPAHSKLPRLIRRQISENVSTWAAFRDAISSLRDRTTTVAENLPLPWHKVLPSDVPYSIGEDPSASGLPIELNRFMPPVWRGPNPDPSVCNKDARAYVDDTERLLAEKHLVFDPTLDLERKLVEQEDDYDDPLEPHEKDIFSRILAVKTAQKTQMMKKKRAFHQKILGGVFNNPAYSHAQAFNAAALQLVGVRYHTRRIILDLKNCILEVHLLLHTSVNLYTNAQWERVSRVPKDFRGWKCGFAILMEGYVLSFNSADNNLRVFWQTRKRSDLLQRIRPPDAVLNYFGWLKYGARWLHLYGPKSRTATAIYQWLAKPGSTHHMQGDGSYNTDEILARAGIPPWASAFDVLNDPISCYTLHETHFDFLLERVYRTKDHMKTSRKTNGPGEYTFVIWKEPLGSWQATGIENYNALTRNTHFKQDVDLSSATHPFDLANIRHSCLLWGHLGSEIVGDANHWQFLLKSEGEAALQYNRREFDLAKFTETFPNMLQGFRALLEEEYGLVNPLVQYFHDKPHLEREAAERKKKLAIKKKEEKRIENGNAKKKGKDKSPSTQKAITKYFSRPGPPRRIPAPVIEEPEEPTVSSKKTVVPAFKRNDPGNLHLVPDSSFKQKRGTSWTLFDVPLIQSNKSNRLWAQFDDNIRLSRTIEHIKAETKEWTVGWADFCGHAQAFGEGYNGPFAALCRWDPGITAKQRQRVESHWNARGLYTEGMRKLPKYQLEQETRWRVATTKQIREEFEDEQMQQIMEEYEQEQLRQPKNKRKKITPEAIKKALEKKIEWPKIGCWNQQPIHAELVAVTSSGLVSDSSNRYYTSLEFMVGSSNEHTIQDL